MDEVDPFEVQMKFIRTIRNLPNLKSIQSAHNYCYRYYDFREDLFKCILDELTEVLHCSFNFNKPLSFVGK